MEKYMKPALTAVQLESNEILNLTATSVVVDNPNLTKRLEEDEFLNDLLEPEDLNPWKRNK